MSSSPNYSRRDLFRGRFLDGLRSTIAAISSPPPQQRAPDRRLPPPRGVNLAVIRTHACLAYPKGTRPATPCRVCADTCQVDGAIVVSEGKPEIVADRCTGCGECITVCPAPSLAIMLVPVPAPRSPGDDVSGRTR